MTFSDIVKLPPTQQVYICGRCGKKARVEALYDLLKLGWKLTTYGGVDISRIVYFCSDAHMRAYHLKIL